MRFLHAADIHLDSPLRGLDRYEGAPADEIRGATRRALENLVTLAIEEEVDFVILGGDLFDGDWPDFNTGLFFVRQMVRLDTSDIPVFAVRGNHDAESKMSRKLPWPRNVRFFSSSRPETLAASDVGVVLHGQSFPNQKVIEDLAARYPSAVSGQFNIGVLHTSLDGREGHAVYAPTSLDVLRTKGYDYWALGHVHKREIVSRDPLVVFPGNTQGRHIRETGSKGCDLVTLDGDDLRSEHRPLDVLRWCVAEIDISGAADLDEILGRVAKAFDSIVEEAGDHLRAVRTRLVGRSEAHRALAAGPRTVQEQIRALALDRSRGLMWVEKVQIATSAAIDLGALKRRTDPIGEVVRQLEAMRRGDGTVLSELMAELQPIMQKLPPEITEGADGIRLDTPEYLRELLEGVEAQLLSRIFVLEGGS
jgi:exonuclease SbcD